jgi:tRNA-2-methylthio-N6-dimethylallyladenosine synthase
MPRTYQIVTFGCQMNAYDSEAMAGVLQARGWVPAGSPEATSGDADVVLLNTCIVRASAEQRALGRTDALKALRAGRPDRILGVCGCLAQRDAEALLERAPHLDLVLGTRAIPRLGELLDRIERGEGPIACVEDFDEPYATGAQPVRRSALRALVTIMQGCDNWCTYCIVPSVRGRERSRPAEAILEEVRGLVAAGCREVTLVGQNVNAWRGEGEGRRTKDEGRKAKEEERGMPGDAVPAVLRTSSFALRPSSVDFADLLGRVAAIPGLWRIRYITSHPRDAGPRQIDAVARLAPQVCDHFHLPVQAGSNAVLERMNRGYTREHYLGLVEAIRERLPDATITTDLIVGFPGETEADFAQTLDLVKRVRFDAAFTFFYNVRTGTRAAQWPDDVPLAVKKERLARLIRMQETISLEKNRALVGREVEVLVEGLARRHGEGARAPEGGGAEGFPESDARGSRRPRGNLLGRTRGDKCVVFEGDEALIGQLGRVRVVEAAGHTLLGERA